MPHLERDRTAGLRPPEQAFGQLEYPTVPVEPDPDEVVAHVLAHHARQAKRPATPPPPAPGYRPEVLAALFGIPPATGVTS